MDQPNKPVPEAAQAMVEVFASVGAQAFDVTYTDTAGNKVRFDGALPAQALCDALPQKLAWAVERQLNVIIRPRAGETVLIQLDDLGKEKAERLRPVTFLGLETSPGNYQAWVALPAAEAEQDFARRLRKGAGADANASGSARIAGSINFKQKHSPNFPVVRLTHTTPGLLVTRAQIEALVRIAAPEPRESAPSVVVTAKPFAWPSYQRCLDGAPLNGDRTGPDRSRVDYTWCQTAITWGWGVEETAERLMELSEKASENGWDYALRTAQSAVAGAEEWRRRKASVRGRSTSRKGAA